MDAISSEDISKEKIIESITLKMSSLDDIIMNIKCKFQNIDEKKNRIFEDELMNLELEKNTINRLLKRYQDSSDSNIDLKTAIDRYELMVDNLNNKYKV